jgi:hypothetical protein
MKKGYWSPLLTLLLTMIVMVAALMLNHAPVNSAVSEGGTLWESARLMSTTAQDGAFIPVLKGDSTGRLIIVYNEVTDTGVENPYYRESVNGGANWHEPKRIFQSEESLRQVTFGFDADDKAHAVWRTQSAIWHSSEDQWPIEATPITSTVQLVFSPDIAVAPDNTLHVVWSQQDNHLYHAYSKDGGLTWTLSPPLTNGLNKSDEPAVDADPDGNVHVVWEERIYDPVIGNFRFEIRYLSGTVGDTEVSWASAATKLSGEVIEARRPAIAAQGEDIHVSFAHRISDSEQYAYYVRHTNGPGWGVPVDITQDNPVAMNSSIPFLLVPALALCDDGPSIYFHGSLASNGKELILGVNDADDQLLNDQVSSGEIRAIRPSVACVNGILHMVYEQVMDPNINHQVYYLSKSHNAVFLPLVIKK